MRSSTVVVLLSLCLCAFASSGGCRSADEAAPPAAVPTGEPATAAPPGMKAYVDPATGKLTDRPPAGVEPIPGDVKLPPVAVEKPAPGGGSQLQLQPEPDQEQDEDRDAPE